MEETINKIQKKFQKEKRDLMQPLKNLMDENKILGGISGYAFVRIYTALINNNYFLLKLY